MFIRTNKHFLTIIPDDDINATWAQMGGLTNE